MSYDVWAASVPDAIRADPLWGREEYRLSLYIADLGWDDLRRLAGLRAASGLCDPLCRGLGAIGPNIARGYQRASTGDRARFHEHALHSARESRDLYLRARHVLGPRIVRQRLRVLSTIVRLLTCSQPDTTERDQREHQPAAAPCRSNMPPVALDHRTPARADTRSSVHCGPR